MKQACLDLNLNARKTRKQAFLEQMDDVVPWAELVKLITPYYSEGKTTQCRRFSIPQCPLAASGSAWADEMPLEPM